MDNKQCTKCKGIYDFEAARILMKDEEFLDNIKEPEFGEEPFVCPRCQARDNLKITEEKFNKVFLALNTIVFQTEKFTRVDSIKFYSDRMEIRYFADKDTYVEKQVY